MSYDNGHSVPPTPGGYHRAPSFPPPPTPIQQQAPYDSHPSYQPSAPESFYSVYSSSAPTKKKNTRASQVITPASEAAQRINIHGSVWTDTFCRLAISADN
jgi:hypothetical protein